jgi:hypothetical protein
MFDEFKQAVNFLFGAVPILSGKTVEGDIFDGVFADVLNHPHHVQYTFAMPAEPG